MRQSDLDKIFCPSCGIQRRLLSALGKETYLCESCYKEYLIKKQKDISILDAARKSNRLNNNKSLSKSENSGSTLTGIGFLLGMDYMMTNE